MLVAHLSDLHLGRMTPPHGAERLNSFRQAIVTLAGHDPDTVLIAGDMFEGPHVDQTIIEEAAKSLVAAKSGAGKCIPVIIIPGNHDPADAEKLWTTFQKAIEPGCDVRLALTPRIIELADGKLLVEAYPCATRFSAEPPWEKRLPTPQRPGSVRVVVAHGTLQGGPVPEDEGDAYPFTQAGVEALDADYVALGHFHGVYPPWPDRDECERRVCYCGTHEPDQFDSDAGYAILATIDPTGSEGDEPSGLSGEPSGVSRRVTGAKASPRPVRLRRIKVGKRQWRLVNVSGPAELGKLETLYAQVQADTDPEHFVVRLKVADTGWTADDVEHLDRLEKGLRTLGATVDRRGEVQICVDAQTLDLSGLASGAVKEALLSLQAELGHATEESRRELLAAALQIGWDTFREGA